MAQLGTLGQEAGFQCLLRTPSWVGGSQWKGLSWEVLNRRGSRPERQPQCCLHPFPKPLLRSHTRPITLHEPPHIPLFPGLSLAARSWGTRRPGTRTAPTASAHQLSPCGLKERCPAGRGAPGFPPASSRNRSLAFSVSTSCTPRLAVLDSWRPPCTLRSLPWEK